MSQAPANAEEIMADYIASKLKQQRPLPSEAPFIDEAIVAWLDAVYPERCPDPSMAERDIWIEVGRRMLVRELIALHNAQFQKEDDA